MTDLGILHHFLWIFVTYNASGTFLHQQNYTAGILCHAHMTDCNPYHTPVDIKTKLYVDDSLPVLNPQLYCSLAGALQYLTFTKPEISFAVQQVCLFMHDPQKHFLVLVRILCYIKGTISHCIQINTSRNALVVYSDADWTGDIS